MTLGLDANGIILFYLTLAIIGLAIAIFTYATRREDRR